MVNTRVAELKKDQEATQTVVSSLVDRLEAITVQIKEMQDQACQKWEGIRLQLVSMENAIQERREGRADREQSVTWEGNVAPRPIRDSKNLSENRDNSLPKLEFPDFDGTNLEDWVYRSDRFFELERTSKSENVRIASIYMYGKALQWHYTFIRNRGQAELLLWGEYVEALTRRFGKAVFEDPMGRLKNLKQEGAYDNLYVYMEEFDCCLRKVLEKMDLPEEFQISLFINGLKEEFRRTLWLLKSTCLLDVQSNARLISNDIPVEPEGGVAVTEAGSSRVHQRNLVQFPGARVPGGKEMLPVRTQGVNTYNQRHSESRGNSQPMVVRKRLSQEEINERRNKGLCFGCNEPYFRDHKCSRRQLYSTNLESLGEKAAEGEEVNHYLEEEDSAPVLTLHAINGETDSGLAQTMRLTGQFKKRTIHILVDSGSTHNFLDAKVAKRLGLACLTIKPVVIMVADGRKMQSTKAMKGFTWRMQRNDFMADLYVIPLKGCEMVLGIKWLAQLGDVTWNFQTLTMRFTWRKEPISLQGRDGREEGKLILMEEIKNLQKRSKTQLISFCWVKLVSKDQEEPPQRGSGQKEQEEVASVLTVVLGEFANVFREPTALPPRRLKE